jgi:anti-anti-sigma factor
MVAVDRRAETMYAVAYGELDRSNADAFSDQFELLLAERFRRIVIDPRRVSFIDAGGVRALLFARKRSAQHGVELALIKGAPDIERVLAAAGVEQQLRLVELNATDWT